LKTLRIKEFCQFGNLRFQFSNTVLLALRWS
jgi:hypothetical protein